MEKTDIYKKESRNSVVLKINNYIKIFLKYLLNEIIGFCDVLEKSGIISKMNPKTSDSNIFLKGDQTLDDREKVTKTNLWKNKRHFGTSNEKDGFNNFSASENCSSTEPSGLCIGNFQTVSSDYTSTNAVKGILNLMVSDTDACNRSHTPHPLIVDISSEESDNCSQSSSSGESETSTSTIEYLDNGSKISASKTCDEESSDFNLETSNTAANFSDSDSKVTSTTMTKRFRRVRNSSSVDSMHCNSEASINIVECFSSNTERSVASMNCSVIANPTYWDPMCELSMKFSDGHKADLDDIHSDSDSKLCKALQFSDSDSESHHSPRNFSDTDTGSYHSNLKFSDLDEMFYTDESSNPLALDILIVVQELRSLINNADEFPGIDQKAATTAEEFSGIDPNFDNNQEVSSNSDEATDNETDSNEELYFSRHDRITFLRNKLEYLMRISREVLHYNQNAAITKCSVELVEHPSVPLVEPPLATSSSFKETTDTDSNTIVDVFKTVVKCHPIKKFEIPPYEYVNAERTLCTTGGKLDDSSSNHAINSLQLYDNDGQLKTLGGYFSNIDSHAAMFFEIEDCFSENSRIICDSLIKEYLNSAAKVKFLLLKQIKDVSTEDYELRMNNIHYLEDEIGYLSAKLIATINDWVKQFQKINKNIQNDAQSETRSLGLYHMGILRICMTLAKILLTFSLGKQLKLEKYENALMFYHKRSNCLYVL